MECQWRNPPRGLAYCDSDRLSPNNVTVGIDLTAQNAQFIRRWRGRDGRRCLRRQLEPSSGARLVERYAGMKAEHFHALSSRMKTHHCQVRDDTIGAAAWG